MSAPAAPACGALLGTSRRCAPATPGAVAAADANATTGDDRTELTLALLCCSAPLWVDCVSGAWPQTVCLNRPSASPLCLCVFHPSTGASPCAQDRSKFEDRRSRTTRSSSRADKWSQRSWWCRFSTSAEEDPSTVWASAKARPVMRWERRGAGLCFARACALQFALLGVGAHLQPLGLLWRRFAVLLMLLSRALGGLGLGRLGMQCEQL